MKNSEKLKECNKSFGCKDCNCMDGDCCNYEKALRFNNINLNNERLVYDEFLFSKSYIERVLNKI